MGPGGAVRPLLAAPGALLRVARRVESEGQRLLLPATVDPARPPQPAPRQARAAAVLAALQERSLHQSSAEAEEALVLAVLLLLVPDEARMLTALDRAGWTPAVDVLPRPRSATQPVVGATLLARQAGVALVERAPAYLARLLALGLLRETEEQEGYERDFEILLAEPTVLRALRSGRHGGRGPQVRRYGVTLSDLGRLTLDVAAEDDS